jgi:hypothetical protein
MPIHITLRLTLASLLLVPFAALAQTTAPPIHTQPQTQPAIQTQSVPRNTSPSAGHDVGSGAGDIGKGAGGAVGNVAKGTGKGAVDLVTLHPIKAAGNVGKSVGVGAKDAGVGAAKGTSKILRGTGKGIKHIF